MGDTAHLLAFFPQTRWFPLKMLRVSLWEMETGPHTAPTSLAGYRGAPATSWGCLGPGITLGGPIRDFGGPGRPLWGLARPGKAFEACQELLLVNTSCTITSFGQPCLRAPLHSPAFVCFSADLVSLPPPTPNAALPLCMLGKLPRAGPRNFLSFCKGAKWREMILTSLRRAEFACGIHCHLL